MYLSDDSCSTAESKFPRSGNLSLPCVQLSFQKRAVTLDIKSAYVTPVLKKVDIETSNPKSYRLISNLSVLSQLLKRLVAQQLVSYLMENIAAAVLISMRTALLNGIRCAGDNF